MLSKAATITQISQAGILSHPGWGNAPRRRSPGRRSATVPVRLAPDMSVLLCAAVRRVARHSWFHDPESPFVQVPAH
jgi:hypothetical protein